MDSTSVLTTEKRHFTKGNHTEFSIDLAIVFNDRNGWHRLIHEKTGVTAWDRYYWNSVPDSRNLAYGSFQTAMVKFEEKRNEYITAIQGICLIKLQPSKTNIFGTK